jgi:hypothetical protein
VSRPYISLELRRLVSDRADCLCEYCLIPNTNGVSFQVDHIISVKHSGSTTADNLSYACIYCNLQKGSDLGSINWQTGELVRFFNPRRDFSTVYTQIIESLPVLELPHPNPPLIKGRELDFFFPPL